MCTPSTTRSRLRRSPSASLTLTEYVWTTSLWPQGLRLIAFSSLSQQPKVASSVEEILADPLVDGVIIVTPNSTHAALVIQVAAAGKACICEKPLDSSLEAIKVLRVQLAELAKKQPLPYIAVGFPKRHDPTYVHPCLLHSVHPFLTS